MPTLYVKKITSYNPSKYKFISLKEAHNQYHKYIESCVMKADILIKTFKEWLTTEI